MKGIIGLSYNLGLLLCRAVYLQVLFVIYCLRGGVVLGLFPSLYGMFKVINQLINGDISTYQDMKVAYKEAYREEFKASNSVGYILLGLVAFLSFDLAISKRFIQQPIIHGALLLLMIMTIGTILYSFPVLIRYNLTIKQVITQSFLMFISNIVEAVAIVISFLLMPIIFAFSPILIILVGLPALVFIVLFFSKQGIIKTEARFDNYENG
ncbi:YesL family protein [Vagococcus zengguangii]|uniref:DUF624 domain-containing protein n=1 Tax=Vagococcus zengguangii TaxID=2571750 RepID=A0A4D7CVB1_9ENTE|nr:DUF624 domain-containing protein [Vagococcus zengguangii]QCI86190.1 DUF624 domain-containing protein [Vagococcus zengguangii]